MKKRVFSFIIAVTFAFTLFPAAIAAAPPAMPTLDDITFENGTLNGFVSNAPNVRLAVSTVQSRSGNRSLLVTGRELGWNGAVFHVEQYIEPGITYDVSVWVRLRAPSFAEISLTAQIGTGSAGTLWRSIDTYTAERTGWTQFRGNVAFTAADIETGHIAILIHSADEAAEYYIDDFSFKPLVRINHGFNLNTRASEMPALRSFYRGHFPLGTIADNGSSMSFLILQQHFNTVTLEYGARGVSIESGVDFIYDAFVFTRMFEPATVIFYNDYSLDDLTKVRAVANMVREINERWLEDDRNINHTRPLIEGINYTAHFGLETNLYNVEEALKLFAATGVEVNIIELDVEIFNRLAPSSSDIHEQALMYAELMRIFKRNSAGIARVTFKGAVFNSNFTPELSYFAVADPDGFLAGNFSSMDKINDWIKANTPSGELFTTLDSLNALRFAIGLITFTPEQFERYDVNKDGRVDVRDALIILQMAVGVI
jgi:hypothetical protein